LSKPAVRGFSISAYKVKLSAVVEQVSSLTIYGKSSFCEFTAISVLTYVLQTILQYAIVVM
jgi:hypothetical protein